MNPIPSLLPALDERRVSFHLVLVIDIALALSDDLRVRSVDGGAKFSETNLRSLAPAGSAWI